MLHSNCARSEEGAESHGLGPGLGWQPAALKPCAHLPLAGGEEA